MPTFDSPAPIDVRLSFIHGDVRIIAAEIPETVVEVRPRADAEVDRRAVAQTTVEFTGDRLEIRTPKPRRTFLQKITDTRDGGISVTIELPAGSSVRGVSGMGQVHGVGRLGDCRFRTGAGDIELEETGALRAETGLGLIHVGQAAGPVEATTARGEVRIGRVDGPATIRNMNGPTEIGEATGDVRITGVNGDVTVGRALSGLAATTADGNLRIGEVRRGAVSLESAAGSIDLGVRDGTAAHLDVSSTVGSVRNALDGTDNAGTAELTVKVYARTKIGTIDVRRSDP